MAIFGWIAKSLKLSNNIGICLAIILFFSYIGFVFIIIPTIEGILYRGEIKELYILDSDDKPLLTAWLMRTHPVKGKTFHDQRLETFELENGKFIGMVEMQHNKLTPYYRLDWIFGSKTIWGIDKDKNAQLISLTQSGFLKNTDPVPQFTENTRDDWRKRVANINQRGWSEKGWSFKAAMGSVGKNLIGPNGKPNILSAILLEPIFIEELNMKAGFKDKIWIFHKSGIHNNIKPLMSYVDFNGKQLNRINLNKIFNKIKTRPFAVYTREKEVMVFVTCGGNKKSIGDAPGFTLTALRLDRATGRYINKIDYIK